MQQITFIVFRENYNYLSSRVFWVVTPCSIVVGIIVSEANAACIFRVK